MYNHRRPVYPYDFEAQNPKDRLSEQDARFFEIFDLSTFWVSLVSFLLGYVAEAYMIIQFYNNGEFLSLLCTLSIICMSSVLCHMISYRWYKASGQVIDDLAVFHVCHIVVFYRFYEVAKLRFKGFRFSIETRELNIQSRELADLCFYQAYTELALLLMMQFYCLLFSDSLFKGFDIMALTACSMVGAIYVYDTHIIRLCLENKNSRLAVPFIWGNFIWHVISTYFKLFVYVFFAKVCGLWIILAFVLHLYAMMQYFQQYFRQVKYRDCAAWITWAVVFCFCYYRLCGKHRIPSLSYYHVLAHTECFCMLAACVVPYGSGWSIFWIIATLFNSLIITHFYELVHLPFLNSYQDELHLLNEECKGKTYKSNVAVTHKSSQTEYYKSNPLPNPKVAKLQRSARKRNKNRAKDSATNKEEWIAMYEIRQPLTNEAIQTTTLQVELPLTDEFQLRTINEINEATCQMQLPFTDEFQLRAINEVTQSTTLQVQLPFTDEFQLTTINEATQPITPLQVQLPFTDEFQLRTINEAVQPPPDECRQPVTEEAVWPSSMEAVKPASDEAKQLVTAEAKESDELLTNDANQSITHEAKDMTKC